MRTVVSIVPAARARMIRPILPLYLERGNAIHLVRGAQKTRGRAMADR